MDQSVIQQLIHRHSDANKYDFGHVLIVGGSPGMVGAPFLAAMGALRVGAGLVTIASTVDVVDKLEERTTEVMTLRISDEPNVAAAELVDFIAKRRVSVLAAGPGMDDAHTKLLRELLPELSIPIILDAGAVTCFHDDIAFLDDITHNNSQVIATPHDGEFEKLTGTKLPTESAAREDVASKFAQSHRMTLLCKGFPTLVAHADGSVYENHTGNPGLATAGSGDVLAGVIAGLVAQGCSAPDAADVGAYLHGLSADIAVKEKTQPGLIASDVAEFLPRALREASKQ